MHHKAGQSHRGLDGKIAHFIAVPVINTFLGTDHPQIFAESNWRIQKSTHIPPDGI
jgi:hypothetical protein